MSELKFITLRQAPGMAEKAAEWFHEKWGVPARAYLELMESFITGGTGNGWYLCLDRGEIVGGLGTVDNDFHERRELSPNICAVYVEEPYRGRGIAGRLLELAVEDMRERGITPLYLVTDHAGFYERYGWELLGLVREQGPEKMTRMYIHT